MNFSKKRRSETMSTRSETAKKIINDERFMRSTVFKHDTVKRDKKVKEMEFVMEYIEALEREVQALKPVQQKLREEADNERSYEKDCPEAFGFDNYGSNNG
jgi:hypothetical protein